MTSGLEPRWRFQGCERIDVIASSLQMRKASENVCHATFQPFVEALNAGINTRAVIGINCTFFGSPDVPLPPLVLSINKMR